jgi:two-component system response regulator NreC
MEVLEQPNEASPAADAGPAVVIVDDHAVVRAGLRLVLEGEGVQVLGEAGCLEDARELVGRTQPDVLVLDLHLGPVTGLTLLEELPELAPDTRTVVLTMQNEAAFVKEALAAGASGYVLKDGAFSELLSAVTAASAGGNYVSPELGARLAVNDGSAHLSPRELEVLRLIALGFTNSEVAEQLFLSVRTVESHRAHVQDKLGVKTRHELVEYALAQGLLPRAAP